MDNHCDTVEEKILNELMYAEDDLFDKVKRFDDHWGFDEGYILISKETDESPPEAILRHGLSYLCHDIVDGMQSIGGNRRCADSIALCFLFDINIEESYCLTKENAQSFMDRAKEIINLRSL